MPIFTREKSSESDPTSSEDSSLKGAAKTSARFFPLAISRRKIIASALVSACLLLSVHNTKFGRDSRSLTTDSDRVEASVIAKAIQKFRKYDFQVAKRESCGLFDNIRRQDWEIMKQRVKERRDFRNTYFENDPMSNAYKPKQWYKINYEPDFTCPHERRVGSVGGLGDGPKWVCDPHRISAQVKERQAQGGNGCLIYSIGSAGNFMFEDAIQQAVGEELCEIHVFDVDDYTGVAPSHVQFHHWGLTSSKYPSDQQNVKTLQETIEILGHQDHVIDIFKIDCEGCEWETFHDWLDSSVTLNQILVEVHYVPDNAMEFFDTLQNSGYVTFRKEISSSCCVEYAFLRLAPKFFE